jgi:hypothetical protein
MLHTAPGVTLYLIRHTLLGEFIVLNCSNIIALVTLITLAPLIHWLRCRLHRLIRRLVPVRSIHRRSLDGELCMTPTRWNHHVGTITAIFIANVTATVTVAAPLR